MRNFRVWILFGLLALGIVAVRILPDAQGGVQTVLSRYGVVALILVIAALYLVYRMFLGRDGKRDPENDHMPWWY